MAGWNPETGRPTAAKLAELGVEEAAKLSELGVEPAGYSPA
jgi:hypothetical protein